MDFIPRISCIAAHVFMIGDAFPTLWIYLLLCPELSIG